MSGTSDSRRREVAQIVLAMVAILAVTAVSSRMLIAAWDDHGLVYHTFHGIARGLGWGIDGVVVFAAFFMLTTVVVFALDENKHVQGALLIAAVALVFVPVLVVTGRWFENVDFLAHPIPALAGILVAGGIIAVDANVPQLHGGGLEFPMAARMLYASTAIIAVVGIFERYLTYQSPLVVVENPPAVDQLAAGPLTVVGDLVSVVGLIYLVGYFTRYSDVTNVVISAPDNETVAWFLGGLYGEADARYGATSLEGGDVLNAARSQQHSLPRINGRVAFQYQPGDGLFVRRRRVSYENLRPVSEQDVDSTEDVAEKRSSLGPRLWFGFKHQLLLGAPKFVRDRLQQRGGAHVDRLVYADTVLLLAPVSDVVRTSRMDSFDEFDEDLVRERDYLTVYDELSETFATGSMPDVMVVATEADIALDYHESDDLSKGRFLKFLRKDVLGLGHLSQVMPVSREDTKRDGFDDLLRSL